jgi:hypothetical protein
VFFLEKNMEYLLDVWKRMMLKKVLKDLHDGPNGGHFADKTTTDKILRVGYY